MALILTCVPNASSADRFTMPLGLRQDLTTSPVLSAKGAHLLCAEGRWN